MSKESWKETLRLMWLTFLAKIGLTTLREHNKLVGQHQRLEHAYNRLMEESGMHEQACCRHHATPAQRMTQMFVCPECGDKRCNKAEICRLPCNAEERKDGTPLFV